MTRPTGSGDRIVIEELELLAIVGVQDEEREQPQRLTASISLLPRANFRDLGDDLARTINYAAVCSEVKRFVSLRSDKLIETLAEGIALHLLERFPIRSVEIELRKFILPDTRFVAVSITRERS
jgi:FolB domain-containing protein